MIDDDTVVKNSGIDRCSGCRGKAAYVYTGRHLNRKLRSSQHGQKMIATKKKHA